MDGVRAHKKITAPSVQCIFAENCPKSFKYWNTGKSNIINEMAFDASFYATQSEHKNTHTHAHNDCVWEFNQCSTTHNFFYLLSSSNTYNARHRGDDDDEMVFIFYRRYLFFPFSCYCCCFDYMSMPILLVINEIDLLAIFSHGAWIQAKTSQSNIKLD